MRLGKLIYQLNFVMEVRRRQGDGCPLLGSNQVARDQSPVPYQLPTSFHDFLFRSVSSR